MPTAKGGNSARKLTAITDPYTKSQLLTAIADSTGLARKDVSAVLDELSDVIHRHLKRRGAGQFTLPGLMKVKTLKTSAIKIPEIILCILESPIFI